MTTKRIRIAADLGSLDRDQLITFLRSDRDDKVTLWNEWRESSQWSLLDLRGAALYETTLDNIVLCNVILDNANLNGSRLNKAIFSSMQMGFSQEITLAARLLNAGLSGTQMQEAVINGVQCDTSNLGQANLEGAQLIQASFRDAQMFKVNLRRAWLQDADLQGAHLFEAMLEDAFMGGVNLENSHLEKSHLERAQFASASLRSANLKNANMNGAHLEKAIFLDAHLENARITFSHLEGAEFLHCHLEGVEFRSSRLSGTNLAGSSLENADLSETYIENVSLNRVSNLNGVQLYRSHLSGLLDLRYDQFIHNGRSTIWEHTEGRFHDAKDVYKMLKGMFEDSGDYEGANWAYEHEQVMEKLKHIPSQLCFFYPKWIKALVSIQENYYGEPLRTPNLFRWLGLELSEKIAGYGLSLARPLFWLALIILIFAFIYSRGLTTSIPGCSYAELSRVWRDGCQANSNLFDNFYFSLATLTSTQLDYIQPYKSHVGLLMTFETLLGIALTGLFGFVLGNKLRFS